MTHGIFPPGNLHGKPKPSTGQGRIVGEDGTVVFRGPVPPGKGLFFQFAYNIPYETEHARLSTVSDVPVVDAAATVRWTSMVSPQARLERPYRSVRTNQGEFVRMDLLHTGGMKTGEVFTLVFDHLPIQTSVPIWIAKAGTVLGLFLFALLLMGVVIRRRREGAG